MLKCKENKNKKMVQKNKNIEIQNNAVETRAEILAKSQELKDNLKERVLEKEVDKTEQKAVLDLDNFAKNFEKNQKKIKEIEDKKPQTNVEKKHISEFREKSEEYFSDLEGRLVFAFLRLKNEKIISADDLTPNGLASLQKKLTPETLSKSKNLAQSERVFVQNFLENVLSKPKSALFRDFEKRKIWASICENTRECGEIAESKNIQSGIEKASRGEKVEIPKNATKKERDVLAWIEKNPGKTTLMVGAGAVALYGIYKLFSSNSKSSEKSSGGLGKWILGGLFGVGALGAGWSFKKKILEFFGMGALAKQLEGVDKKAKEYLKYGIDQGRYYSGLSLWKTGFKDEARAVWGDKASEIEKDLIKKSLKFGLNPEKYKKALEFWKHGKLEEAEKMFGKDKQNFEKFKKEREQKEKIEEIDGVKMTTPENALNIYKEELGLMTKEIIEWVEKHAVEMAIGTYLLYRIGVLKAARVAGGSVFQIAKELGMTLLKAGIKHKFVSLLVAGGALGVGYKAYSKLNKLNRLPAGLSEVGKWIKGNEKEALATMQGIAPDVDFSAIKGFTFSNLRAELGSFLNELPGKMVDTVKSSKEKEVRQKEVKGVEELIKALEKNRKKKILKLHKEEMSAVKRQKEIGNINAQYDQWCSIYLQDLMIKLSTDGDFKLDSVEFKKMKNIVEIEGGEMVDTGTKIIWRMNKKDAWTDLCISPEVKDLGLRYDVSKRLYTGEGFLTTMYETIATDAQVELGNVADIIEKARKGEYHLAVLDGSVFVIKNGVATLWKPVRMLGKTSLDLLQKELTWNSFAVDFGDCVVPVACTGAALALGNTVTKAGAAVINSAVGIYTRGLNGLYKGLGTKNVFKLKNVINPLFAPRELYLTAKQAVDGVKIAKAMKNGKELNTILYKAGITLDEALDIINKDEAGMAKKLWTGLGDSPRKKIEKLAERDWEDIKKLLKNAEVVMQKSKNISVLERQKNIFKILTDAEFSQKEIKGFFDAVGEAGEDAAAYVLRMSDKNILDAAKNYQKNGKLPKSFFEKIKTGAAKVAEQASQKVVTKSKEVTNKSLEKLKNLFKIEKVADANVMNLSIDQMVMLKSMQKSELVKVLQEGMEGVEAFKNVKVDALADSIKATKGVFPGKVVDTINDALPKGSKVLLKFGKSSVIFDGIGLLAFAGSISDGLSAWEKVSKAEAAKDNKSLAESYLRDAMAHGASAFLNAVDGVAALGVLGGKAFGATAFATNSAYIAQCLGAPALIGAAGFYVYEKVSAAGEKIEREGADWTREYDEDTLYHKWLMGERIFIGDAMIGHFTGGMEDIANAKQNIRREIIKGILYKEGLSEGEDTENALEYLNARLVMFHISDQKKGREMIAEAVEFSQICKKPDFLILLNQKFKEKHHLKFEFSDVRKAILNAVVLRSTVLRDTLRDYKKSMLDSYGVVAEKPEELKKREIASARNANEYAIYQFAKFFGYPEVQEGEKINFAEVKKFLSEEKAGQRLIYWSDGWYLNEAGWERDDSMGADSTLSIEKIAKRMEENAADLYETEEDSIFDDDSDTLSAGSSQTKALIHVLRDSYAEYERESKK